MKNNGVNKLASNHLSKRTDGRVCESVDDPTEEFEKDNLFVHGVGKRYKCDQCDQDFSRKGSLKEHIRTKHQIVQKLVCPICHWESSNSIYLKKHIKRMHQVKTIPCGKCSQMFATVGMLNSHKKQVHVSKSFECDQCNKKYKTQTSLNAHIRSIHEKTIPCDVCTQMFSTVGMLQVHKKQVHVLKSFECDQCKKGYNTERTLKGHKEAVHENKKNWFCKACPYSSYTKTNFKMHMRIHTGEKPYQCNKCLAQFRQQTQLHRHKSNCTS